MQLILEAVHVVLIYSSNNVMNDFILPNNLSKALSCWKEELLGKPFMSNLWFVINSKRVRRVLELILRANLLSPLLYWDRAEERSRHDLKGSTGMLDRANEIRVVTQVTNLVVKQVNRRRRHYTIYTR